jgi:AAA domain
MAFGKQATKSKPISTRTLGDLFTPGTELSCGQGLKIAIWGRSKVGKSHFCLTNPGEIYIIDTESAIKENVKNFPPELRERLHVSDILKFSGLKEGSSEIDYSGMLDVIEEAVDKILLKAKEVGENNITVVLDSASDLWDWLGIWLADVPGVEHIGKDGDKVNRLEWGKANKRYAAVILKLTMSGCNIIFTFKAKDAVGANGADLGYITPRWQKNSNYKFDLIGNIEKIGDKRVLKFTGANNGGRYGDKIPDLENPTWDALMKHLEKQCGVNFQP